MHTFYSIPNLRSSSVSLVTPDNLPVPPEFDSKSKFRAWCADPSTVHAFISTVEGVNPNTRVGSSYENPPYRVHGIMGDYDAVKADNLREYFQRRSPDTPLPTYVSASRSGYLRAVWMFETPVIVQPDVGDAFLATLHKRMGTEKLHAGFDAASCRADQYFEAGADWEQMGGSLPDHTVTAALLATPAVSKSKSSDVEIPIEKIAAEVAKRWPGRWRGPFEEGARGPLFWIDDGIDREGCQIKPDGVLCFSDRAGQPFLYWRELLGKKFVAEYEDAKVGEAVADLWYDGAKYWRTDNGSGVMESKEDVVLRLRAGGFSPKAKKNAPLSEVEQALLHIQTNNRVDGAGPLIWCRDPVGTVGNNRRRVVNTSRVCPVLPADSGDPAHWPWLFEFLHGMLDSTPCAQTGAPPFDFFVTWMQRYYQSMLDRVGMSGHCVILCGEAGVGKSFFTQVVLGQAVGGSSDAADFLLGSTSFNKEISESPLWYVGDAMSATTYADHRKFTEIVKKHVADPHVMAHKKGIDNQMVPWYGRILMTTNLDPHSMTAIPSLDQSNRDKLMAFKLNSEFRPKFGSNSENHALVAKELPHMLRWLLDFEPDPRVMGSPRFGLHSYFHPDIEAAARDNSPRQHVLDVLGLFMREKAFSDMEKWEGTTIELLGELKEFPGFSGLSMLRNEAQFMRDLSSAEEYTTQHEDMLQVRSTSTGQGKKWTITNPK